MSDKSRFLVAAGVLLVGVISALVIPVGTCPHGGRLDPLGDGGYWCHVSDVGYAATSLNHLRIGVVVCAVVAAAILTAPVLRRRSRHTGRPAS
jgi:hypothetical protein